MRGRTSLSLTEASFGCSACFAFLTIGTTFLLGVGIPENRAGIVPARSFGFPFVFVAICPRMGQKSAWLESNQLPLVYQTSALTTRRYTPKFRKWAAPPRRLTTGGDRCCLATDDQLSPAAASRVEVTGIEPAPSWSRTRRSSRLSYTSKSFQCPSEEIGFGDGDWN